MLADKHNGFHKIRLGLVTAAFLFVMLMFIPVSHAGGLGFAPLALITGIAGYVTYFRLPIIRAIPGVVWTLLLFLIWALATSAWSPYQATHALSNPVKLLIGVIAFLGTFLLTPRQWLWKFIIFIAVVLLALIAIELYSDYALSSYFFDFEKDLPNAKASAQRLAGMNSIYQNLSHSITVLALLTPLFIIVLRREVKGGNVIAGLWVLAFMYLAFKAGLTVAIVAVFFALFFMFLTKTLGRWAVDLLFGLAISSILFAPLVGYFMNFIPDATKQNMADSWEHRVEMWGYVAEKISEKPIWGHGFDASRTFDRTYSGMEFNGKAFEQTIISLHPHNAGLHIWVETGAIGAALACLVLFMLRQAIIPVTSSNRDTTYALVGFLAAALTLCSFTYGIWQDWFWGVLILIGALISKSILNAR